MIIDLRYNGGGLVSVAEVLASLLAGPVNVDMEFSTTIFNSAHVMENKTTVFQMEANALPLSKIVFITSEGSASASELVINGLKPYFSDTALAQVGSPTYGKPVGQFGFDFCNNDFRLRAVTFKSINADDEGDYFNGLSVDCPAADDLLNPLGDANEASLAEALAFVETGACSIAAAPGFTISSAKARARPVTGPGLAQQYAGAF